MKNSQSMMQGRRRFISRVGAGAAGLGATGFLNRCFADPGFFADHVLTPAQTEGPFYPNHLPLDTDNDLLIINDSTTPAIGEICHLSGRVMSPSGEPVRNSVVEIWQADNNGCYLHTGSDNRDKQEKNFQGFGRFTTNDKGEYYFRTIKPVAYKPRTPHIHFAVYRNGQRVLTTQCYIRGHELNENDVVLKGMKDSALRKLLMVDFKPLPSGKLAEFGAQFDIVIGHTPQDRKDG